MGEPIRHEIHMDSEVAQFYYGKFVEFMESNPEFSDLTFARYLGDVVLTPLKALMDGVVPEVKP